MLNESFINLFLKDLNKRRQLSQEVWDKLQKAYSSIGGLQGKGFDSIDTMINDIPFWKLVKKGGKVVAGVFYKDKEGRKRVAAFTDGTPEGKKSLAQIMIADLTLGRAYVEMSGPSLSFNLKNVPDFKKFIVPKDKLESLLKEKLNFDVPDDDPEVLKHPELKPYFYQREIGDEWHTKICVGSPYNDIVSEENIDLQEFSMNILTELTQRVINKKYEGFKGSALTAKPNSPDRVMFVWESSVPKEDFISANSSLYFESQTIASLFDVSPIWEKWSEDTVGFSFDSQNIESSPDSMFEVSESITLQPSPHWQLQASFPDCSSPEELPLSIYDSVENLCESLEKQPVWFLSEAEGVSTLTLRLSGSVAFDEPRDSFYEDDFVQENKGHSSDWEFSLLDLKKLGYEPQEVLEMFMGLDTSVSEEVDRTLPDTSSVVRDYGVVEDTVIGKPVVYFIIGKNNMEYRYTYKNGNSSAKEGLEAYKDDVRKTGSLGVSYNKFIKKNNDFEEVLNSFASLQSRGMEATYISPKDKGASISASKAHDSNVARRTGKRYDD